MPADNDISLAVQDFEIESEQMSSTRYIGTFTVRFSPMVKSYFDRGAVMGNALPSGQQRPGMVTTDSLYVPPVPAQDIPSVPAQQAPVLTPQTAQGAPGLSSGIRPRLNIDQAIPRQPDEHGIIWNDPPAPSAGNVEAAVNQAVAANTSSLDNPAAPVAQVSSILVLPYYENISGQTLLWEEPNPWLHMWQNDAPRQVSGGPRFIVPLGDIEDIAQGPSNAVWTGNYKTLEALRRHYHADAVALAVANRSGPNLSIDMYYYRDGNLRRRITLTPFVPADATDEQAFKRGVSEVARSLMPKPDAVPPRAAPVYRQPAAQAPASVPVQAAPLAQQVFKPQPRPSMAVPDMPRAPSAAPVAEAAPAAQALPAGVVQVTAQMTFSTFGGWMDVQRRVAAIDPPVRLDLRAISSNSAQFTLTYAGSVEALVNALAGAGLSLGAPAQTPGGVVYDLSSAH
jgi:hypothetical protein